MPAAPEGIINFQPIFHCNTKRLTLGLRVGYAPNERRSCANTNMLVSKKRCGPNVTPSVPIAIPYLPNVTPNASQWNILCIGYMRVRFVLGMYISSCLCRFCLRWAPNVDVPSSGIWALHIRPAGIIVVEI